MRGTCAERVRRSKKIQKGHMCTASAADQQEKPHVRRARVARPFDKKPCVARRAR